MSVRFSRILLAGGALLLLLGCASYTEETRGLREDFRAGRWDLALSSLESSSIKRQGKNRLLFLLEKAMIKDRMGEREASRRLLLEADKVVDELFTVSVSQTAATFVVNDAVADYPGEDYEKVAIHTMLALSFLEDGLIGEARVEARRINTRLGEINAAYGDKPNQYREDAFARYLAGIIWEARGEWDSAIIDYNRALELYSGEYAGFVQGGVPSALPGTLWRLYKKRARKDRLKELEKRWKAETEAAARLQEKLPASGEIVVIHEVGQIAFKETSEHLIPFGRQVIRLSFPVIRRQSGPAGGRTGMLINGEFTRSDWTQDMDAIAAQTLEDRRLRLVAKQGARLLAKGQLTEQAWENFGPLGGLAANVFTAVTETADTRSWTLLPQAFAVTRRRVPPGAHKIELLTGGRTTEIKELSIKDGELVILRSIDR